MRPIEYRSVYFRAAVYFLLAGLLWFIVDFGTAGGFRIGYLVQYGPTLWIFYIGYPLAFTFLIFALKFDNQLLFLATLAGIFIVEIIFTKNPLIMNFPVCLIGIPLAVAVYAPLTYFPLWIVNREVKRRLRLMLFLSLVEAAVICLTVFGSGDGTIGRAASLNRAAGSRAACRAEGLSGTDGDFIWP